MKKLLAAVFASAALLATATANADDNSAAVQVRVPTSIYKLAPQEFNDFAHRYIMATGDSLQLRQSLNRYYAKLNGGAEVEIYGQQPGVFVASTGTRLEFHDDGDQLVMINGGTLPGASPALAGLPEGTPQVAQR